MAIQISRQHLNQPLTRPLHLAALGVLALIIGIFDGPRVAALALSPDGQFSGSTELELTLLRVAALGTAALLGAVAHLGARYSRESRNWLRALRRDAEDWSNQPTILRPTQWDLAWLIATIIYLASMFAVLYLGQQFDAASVPGWYRMLIEESGLYETLTATMLFGASLALFAVSRELRKAPNGPKWWAIAAPASLGFLLFVAAGEEISWGQHYLGFSTPDSMSTVNVQNELNLHNIGGYWANNALLAFFVGFAGVLPLLNRFFWDVGYVCDRLHVPVTSLMLAPIALISFVFDEREPFASLFGHPIWRLSEIREALFGIVMLAICSEFWIRHRTPTTRPRST